MGRDDLCITVPSFFRCPISLDVMKSPVSLCTGVTYDRASIQRWLDDGNNTCPATMQVLHSKDFVPNRTLHRLIQIWSESVRLRRVDSDANNNNGNNNSPPAKDQVVDLIQQMDSHSSSIDSLSKIVRFAKESEENRKFLAKSDGFVQLLVEALGGGNAGDGAHGNNNIRILEQIVRIIELVIGEIQDSEILMRLTLKKSGAGAGDCLASLLLLLQQGSAESRIASARVLESIAVSAESKLLIAERDGLLPELLKLTSPEKDPILIEAGLSCLIAVSVPKRVKVKLVQLGAVKSLSKLLSDSNSTTSTIEKVLKLLETVSSVKEGRAKICEADEDDGSGNCCLSAIVQRLLKVSSSATEHAVTILWSVCYLFKERSAQEAVAKANGLTKILLLMQSNCSPCVRQMSADLLKMFRVNSKSTISCYDTKTTHIMPF